MYAVSLTAVIFCEMLKLSTLHHICQLEVQDTLQINGQSIIVFLISDTYCTIRMILPLRFVLVTICFPFP